VFPIPFDPHNHRPGRPQPDPHHKPDRRINELVVPIGLQQHLTHATIDRAHGNHEPHRSMYELVVPIGFRQHPDPNSDRPRTVSIPGRTSGTRGALIHALIDNGSHLVDYGPMVNIRRTLTTGRFVSAKRSQAQHPTMATGRDTQGRRTFSTLVVVLGTAVLLAGCSINDTQANEGSNLKVVAAFYPLEFLADRIGDDNVDITSMTPSGADAHDVELSPQQVAEIQEADLVLYVKGFQPAMDVAVEQQAKDTSLDLGAGLERLSTEGEDGRNRSDPHVWLDPLNMITMSGRVTQRLVELDSKNQANLEENQDRLDSNLESVDETWRDGTSECESRDLLVSHEAFGYLAKRYDLSQIGISGLTPETEPSPARVAEMAELAKQDDVTTIYYESSVDPQIAETIANEAGIEAAVLDPLATLPEGESGDYFSIMLKNLASVSEGQRCK
jgi:zinc transport system substrate-binding protein